jgi:hypothetical protein
MPRVGWIFLKRFDKALIGLYVIALCAIKLCARYLGCAATCDLHNKGAAKEEESNSLNDLHTDIS